MGDSSTVVVGQRLGRVQDYVAGDGTYVRNGMIISSVLGKKAVEETTETGQKVLDSWCDTPFIDFEIGAV
ncbi:hypothetical protein AYI68_g2860 [Smittium mucronatum]|uniref:Exosome complex component N-terminal domain-containing protein n=1 Tax=Smittium mucronatum TaxID=133383 RepID=A0A1R0H1K2_9FUNG|nr:hypothetical protein AYI68_g2860 [Smittium mucronatum]